MREIGVFLFIALALVVECCDAAPDGASPRMETILIKGASFMMGTQIRSSRDPKYHDDEAPLEVIVEDFRIGKYPVTAAQMCIFLNAPAAKEHDGESLYNHEDIGPYTFSTVTLTKDHRYVPRKNAAKAPANQVTWKGAVLFCKWLSATTGKEYRLPTEAEWELAAAGKERRSWPWGDQPPSAKYGPRFDNDKIFNSQQLADRMKNDQPTWETTPVGSHPVNATPEGVHDMLAYIIGEWCANKYAAHPSADQVVNADMDLNDMTTDRVVRGYYHRPQSRAPLLPLAEWPKHGGRLWTRVNVHPINAVKQAARHGFRVVEQTDTRKK